MPTAAPADPTLRPDDLPTARAAILALRLCALLAGGFEIVYQYFLANLTQVPVPQFLLSLWLLVECTLWITAVFLLTSLHQPGATPGATSRAGIGAGPPPARPAPPPRQWEDLRQPAGPGAIPPATSVNGNNCRIVAILSMAVLLIWIGIHHGLIPDAFEQPASLAYLALRALALALLGQQLLLLARGLSAVEPLVAPTRFIRTALSLALTLWLAGWTVLLLDQPLGLQLHGPANRITLVYYLCSGAEWLLVGALLGAFVLLGRFLRAANVLLSEYPEPPADTSPPAQDVRTA